MPDNMIARTEFQATLDRIDSKLDALDKKFEAAIQGRLSIDVFAVTRANLEKRIEKLEGRPERWLPWLALGMSTMFWVLSRVQFH